MTEKEVKKKLAEAKQYRYYAQYTDAIVLLHQIVEAYPEAIYFYLLAGTYLETGENDLALQYLDEALLIKPDCKEAYELKAKSYENKKEYIDAEKMYLKALEIDPDFMDARHGLVHIYWHKQNDYKKVKQQCEIVFERQNIFGFTKEEFRKKDPWLMGFYTAAKTAYFKLEEYDNMIKLIDRYKYVLNNFSRGEGPLFGNENVLLYKLYYLWGEKEKQQQMKEQIQKNNHMSDKYIRSLEKDANQGFIETFNRDNYEINPNGSFA